jgi:ankyrin repeat protein
MGCNSSKENGAIEHAASRSMGMSMVLSKSMSRDVTDIATEILLKGGRGINVNHPERLFLLLEKALCQQRKPKTPGGGMDVDFLDDLTSERQKLYDAAIEQITRTSGAKNSAAKFVHPTTKQTPLHLACRLVDVDQNQVSAKELCRVMDALLRSYPEALETKDHKGHVPLHYAVAPNQFYGADHVNSMNTPTNSNGDIMSTKKAISTASGVEQTEGDENNINNSRNDSVEIPLYDVDGVDRDDEDWRARGIFAQHLFHSNLKAAHAYWQQSDVVFDEEPSSSNNSNGSFGTEILSTGGCSPLYRVLQTLPDDFDRSGPTVDYIKVLLQASYWYDEDDEESKEALEADSNNNNMAGVGNASDGDKPLGLLYRRFTRQFDISEMFFPGDNSREEVVRHREKYKFAAGNTWKIIEALLKPPAQHVQDTMTSKIQQQQQQPDWGIVHRAVQMETPPDLLRYIVETNAQDLTKVDAKGNLPLHYAAMVKPPKPTTSDARPDTTAHFPSFYSKYVADELLYKFPEAAGMKNANGNFPLTLAVTSGKQWIGGGIKSLYDAYPNALGQIDLKKKQHMALRRALSMGGDRDDDQEESQDATAKDEYKEMGPTNDETLLQQATSAATTDTDAGDGIIKDEHHDAIMLVQKSDVDCREVAIAMWAHEEDAGVQMLGCCAIARLLKESNAKNDGVDSEIPLLTHTTLRTALTVTASVVNAMKAHPNEMIVQEKACSALQLLAPADGRREVSMVASGAVASVVAAMQAHVGDPNVQEEACAAIAAIVKHGGGDRATVVASVSGVTAILNAIAAHPVSVKVQKEGLNALWQLTNFDASDASMPELPRAQTAPLLAQVKESYPDECGELVDKLTDRMKE